jgi:hypothetical protein
VQACLLFLLRFVVSPELYASPTLRGCFQRKRCNKKRVFGELQKVLRWPDGITEKELDGIKKTKLRKKIRYYESFLLDAE